MQGESDVAEMFGRLQLLLAEVAEGEIGGWPAGPERSMVELFIARVRSSYGAGSQRGPSVL